MVSGSNSYRLSPERSLYIYYRLNALMTEKKPFLQGEYSMRRLAEDLDIPGHHLSAYLNRTLGLNYNGYINLLRVQHCQQLIREGLADELNLKGLALKCGFRNRNSFTAAFKKFTGIAPSHYRLMIKGL